MIASVFWILHSEQCALSTFQMREREKSVSFFPLKGLPQQRCLVLVVASLSIFCIAEKESLLTKAKTTFCVVIFDPYLFFPVFLRSWRNLQTISYKPLLWNTT